MPSPIEVAVALFLLIVVPAVVVGAVAATYFPGRWRR